MAGSLCTAADCGSKPRLRIEATQPSAVEIEGGQERIDHTHARNESVLVGALFATVGFLHHVGEPLHAGAQQQLPAVPLQLFLHVESVAELPVGVVGFRRVEQFGVVEIEVARVVIEVKRLHIGEGVAQLVGEIVGRLLLVEDLGRFSVFEQVASGLEIARSGSQFGAEIVVAQEEFVRHRPGVHVPGEEVVEAMVAEEPIALGQSHEHTGGIVGTVGEFHIGIVLRVLHHVLIVGGIEVGAVEEQALGEAMGEAEREIDVLLAQVVVGRRLRSGDGARREGTVAEHRETAVDLAVVGTDHQVGIEARALRSHISDGGRHGVGGEGLQIAEAVGVFIAQVEAIEQRSLCVERSGEVGEGPGGVETAGGEGHTAAVVFERLLGDAVDHPARRSIAEEGGRRSLDDLDALHVGQRGLSPQTGLCSHAVEQIARIAVARGAEAADGKVVVERVGCHAADVFGHIVDRRCALVEHKFFRDVAHRLGHIFEGSGGFRADEGDRIFVGLLFSADDFDGGQTVGAFDEADGGHFDGGALCSVAHLHFYASEGISHTVHLDGVPPRGHALEKVEAGASGDGAECGALDGYESTAHGIAENVGDRAAKSCRRLRRSRRCGGGRVGSRGGLLGGGLLGVGAHRAEKQQRQAGR